MDSLTTNTVFGMSTQNNQKSTRSPTGQISSPLLLTSSQTSHKLKNVQLQYTLPHLSSEVHVLADFGSRKKAKEREIPQLTKKYVLRTFR